MHIANGDFQQAFRTEPFLSSLRLVFLSSLRSDKRSFFMYFL